MNITGQKLLALVFLQVVHKPRLLGKVTRTEVALEGFLAGVNVEVLIQVALPFEALVAGRALVRPLVRVRFVVIPHDVGVRRGITTHKALLHIFSTLGARRQ